MKKLTYNQLNFLHMLSTTKQKIAAEYFDCYDGRSTRRLLIDGFIEFKKTCGCDHACGCKAYVRLTEKGQKVATENRSQDHSKAPGGMIMLSKEWC